jgi:hypothetical protein
VKSRKRQYLAQLALHKERLKDFGVLTRWHTKCAAACPRTGASADECTCYAKKDSENDTNGLLETAYFMTCITVRSRGEFEHTVTNLDKGGTNRH